MRRAVAPTFILAELWCGRQFLGVRHHGHATNTTSHFWPKGLGLCFWLSFDWCVSPCDRFRTGLPLEFALWFDFSAFRGADSIFISDGHRNDCDIFGFARVRMRNLVAGATSCIVFTDAGS